MDWTSVATAGVAAIGTGIGGWIGYRIADRQAEIELAKVRAENERLEMAQEEPHRQHRQSIYHDFLDSAYRFDQAARGIEPFADTASYRDWAREFTHRLVAVRLFGTRGATDAAENLNTVVQWTMEDALKLKQDMPRYDARYRENLEQKFRIRWGDTIEAMRLDTAPREAE